MAYQEVLAPATAELIIDAIRSFAAANGWTVSRNDLVGSLRTLTLKHASSDYIHIWNEDADNLLICGSIGYNAALPPLSNPNASKPGTSNVGEGPYTKLFLFADTTPTPYVHVVIETATAGVYRHLSFGMLEEIEAFTGGTYFDASWWSESGSPPAPGYYNTNHAMFGYDVQTWGTTYQCGFRCDFAADSRTNQWFHIGAGASSSDPSAWAGIAPDSGISAVVEQCDENEMSNRSVFHPTDVKVNRVGGYYSRVGSHPNVRVANIKKYTPGDEITIGSDVWKIFPFCRKWTPQLNVNSPVYDQHSDYFAYAYKKT